MLSHLFILTVVFVAYRLSARYFGKQDNLPGPSSSIASWIWGHELSVFKHDACHMYGLWARAFGPFYKIKAALFHPDIMIVSDHAASHHIFADPDTFVKSPAFRPPISNLLGRGIVWAEGDEHRVQRKILSPAFSQEAVKGMTPDILQSAEKLETRITNYVLAAGGRTTINIVPYTSAAALDIIGRVGFGHDFRATIPAPGDKGPDGSALPTTDAGAIRVTWDHLVSTGLLFSSFIAPIVVRAFPSITKAPLPLMRAQGATKLLVKRLAGRLMDRDKELIASGENKGRDILSTLMRSRNQDAEGKRLSDDVVLDNIATLVMVGHETTANVINMTLWQLAAHPDLQAQLREEICTKGRDLEYDDVQRLELLDAVVKEGLRLHPSSPQTERIAVRDDVIPLSTPIKGADGNLIHSVPVSAGQVFLVPFTVLNTNPAVWGADAHEFRPERWMVPGRVPPPSELPSGWSGLLTFCDGPRNCLGWRLAVFEFKVILATLIRSLEFHDTKAVVHQRISPTLQPVVDGKAGVLPLQVTLASS